MNNYAEYYIKSKKPQKKFAIYKKIFVPIIIIGGILCYLAYYVNPQIILTSKYSIESLSTSAINNNLTPILANNDNYKNLINITYDSQGNVALISTNSQTINQLNNNVINACQQAIFDLGAQGIPIALGNFTGIAFLSEIGPKIPIKIKPIGNSKTKIFSKFTSEGVNQTLHEIFIDISTSINVVLPIKNIAVVVNSQILLAESVIVGKIPETYLNTNKLFSLY